MSTDIPDFLRDNAHVPKQYDPKATNPKDAIGSKKLPLDLPPDTIEAEVALAYLEGALKYGRYNWRVAGVRASIYRAALRRHLMCWWNGEDEDPVTKVRHLASAIACAGIILDAELCDKLTDDRPPRADIGKRIREAESRVAHLKELFKDHDPHQYTIADSDVAEVEPSPQMAFTLLPDEVESTFFPLTTGDHDEATAIARLHERVRATEDSANG